MSDWPKTLFTTEGTEVTEKTPVGFKVPEFQGFTGAHVSETLKTAKLWKPKKIGLGVTPPASPDRS